MEDGTLHVPVIVLGKMLGIRAEAQIRK